MAILAETAIPVEMTALEETILEEVTRKRATIAGSQAISDLIVFTTNERRKHETEFAKAQLQSPPPEIEISSDYPVMLSPPPPKRLGSTHSFTSTEYDYISLNQDETVRWRRKKSCQL